MYIFRDGRATVRGRELVDGLQTALRVYQPSVAVQNRTETLDLLLRAGELECALADVDSVHLKVAEKITSAIAHALVANHPIEAQELAEILRTIELDATVQVAPPEGFAYYSLHPLDFADLIRSTRVPSRFAAVIGIRSIGTTLSAVVEAALAGEHVQSQRITLRPSGHPYNRETSFSESQKRWISAMRSRRAMFYVVDEGPGLSGSSFLSVGDALLAAGVEQDAIVFLGSRHPDPSALTARDAVVRWPAFHADFTKPTVHLPKDAKRYVAGGIWRSLVFSAETDWPASWLQMERLKFISEDHDVLYKFEGFGRFGAEVNRRAVAVAEGGFGPYPKQREEGFGVYPWLRGQTPWAEDARVPVLKRAADYCAFRVRSFGVTDVSNQELENMLRFNVQEEFGAHVSPDCRLAVEHPVVCDGRMLPHKWIDTGGALMKVDSASHGDDHFFPGPTDIAWDVAGTIVEWQLGLDGSSALIERYRRQSGDHDIDRRLHPYLLAYSVFRTAYSRMAAATMRGAPEEARLLRDYAGFRLQAENYLQKWSCGTLRRIAM